MTGTQKTMRDAILTNFDDYLGDGSTWIQFVDPGFVGSSSIRANVGNIMTMVRDTTPAQLGNTEESAKNYWESQIDIYYNQNPNNIRPESK